MINPLVSIIIPFYNEEHYIKRCLESVKNQSYKQLEVILINDGSTDGSLKVIESYVSEFELCQLITISNSGQAIAKNYGLKAANGAYVTFLDADDELEPQMVEHCIGKIIHDAADIVVCRFSIINFDGAIEITSGWKDGVNNIFNTQELAVEMFLHRIAETVWAKLYRTDLAKKIIFDSGLWFDDIPYLFEYLLLAKKAAYIQESLLKIHKRDSSITRRLIEPKRIVDGWRAFELGFEIMKKYSIEDNNFRLSVVNYHLNFIVDNYILQVIDQDKIIDIRVVRKTYSSYLGKFNNFLDLNKISIGIRSRLTLYMLRLHSVIGWRLSDLIIKKLKKNRFTQIMKLK